MDDEVLALKERLERLEEFTRGLYALLGQCVVTTHAATLTTRAIGEYVMHAAEVEGRVRPKFPLLNQMDELAYRLEDSLKALPDEKTFSG